VPSDAGAEPRILIVDDDGELCALMSEYLGQHHFRVEVAQDGRSGLALAVSGEHDLIILDVMLPVLDGFEVLRQLRRRSLVPVIMLTARAATDDRVTGLNEGADDYLPKPFNPPELVAHIRAVLRRSGKKWQPPADLAEANGVRVSADDRQAWCDDVALALTTVEFEILDLLVRSAGRVVSRDQIAAVLYQREVSPYERAVDVHVSHLRKKLQAAGRDPIRTVRGAGYLFQRS
jgi:two-component system response regulator CpxR